MSRVRRTFPTVWALAADMAAGTLAVGATAHVVGALYPTARVGFADATVLSWATVGIAVLGAYMAGLDRPAVFGRQRTLLGHLVAVAAIAAIGGTTFHQMAWLSFPGRIELFVRWLVLAAAMFGWRSAVGFYLNRRARHPAVVLGTSAAALHVADLVNRAPASGHVVVGVSGAQPPPRYDRSLDVPYLGHPSRLIDFCRDRGIETVIVCTNGQTTRWVNVLAELRANGVRVATADAFTMDVTDRMPHEIACATFLLDAFEQMDRGVSESTKRVLDVAVSVVGLTFFTLLWPVLYVAVKLDSPGPFLYSQERVGYGGRIFRIHKIRTMTGSSDDRQRWATASDRRVTRVGRFLRKTRIDELPQFWNVLKGEMSVVGPRPEQPALAARVEERLPAFRWRTLVKPGITGWAQIHYGYADSLENTAVKLSYDLYYVRNYSVVLDVAIMLRTLTVMLTGAGAR